MEQDSIRFQRNQRIRNEDKSIDNIDQTGRTSRKNANFFRATIPVRARQKGGGVFRCLYSSRMFIVINLAGEGGNSVLPEVRAFCTIVVRDRSLGRNSTGTRNSLLMSSRFPPPSIPPPLLRFQTSFHRTFSDPGTASTWLELVITSRSYRAWSRNLASCVHSFHARLSRSRGCRATYTFVFTRLWPG